MNKILSISIFLIVSLIFVSCSKTPFKAQESLNDKALVYIYVKTSEGLDDNIRYPKYSIKIDGEYIDGDIEQEEYIALDVDPVSIKISAIRADLEIQSLKLNLIAGNVYYLRIQSFSDDFAQFNFEELQKNIALEEIILTTNATTKEDEKEQDTQVLSKSDEIQKAYELKEKGILSDEEFKKLKAEILDANR